MIKILFVDDEQDVLDGIKRMLNVKKNEWELYFSSNPREAIELLKNNFDIAVIDLIMPEIDGIHILKLLAEKYPQTIRFAFTGTNNKELITDTINLAHQLLSKPTTRTEIINRIEKALRLKKLFTNKNLAALITGENRLPTLPENYFKMQNELEKEYPSLKIISQIVEKDMTMTAQVLRLVNSAFFSIPKEITSIQEAVNMLGINVIKSIVLYVELFNFTKNLNSKIIKQLNIWQHSIKIGLWSKALFSILFPKEITSDSAYIAGLLHDIGYLIISQMENYDVEIRAKLKEGLEIFEAEKNIFNANHAEVGAYLLSVWNLPEPVIRAVANHHEPGRFFHFDKLSKVVFIANLYENKEKFNRVAGNYLTPEEIKQFEEKIEKEKIPIL